ncbi:hypothetical protein KI387_007709, partial [Taxus chinensis]
CIDDEEPIELTSFTFSSSIFHHKDPLATKASIGPEIEKEMQINENISFSPSTKLALEENHEEDPTRREITSIDQFELNDEQEDENE